MCLLFFLIPNVMGNLPKYFLAGLLNSCNRFSNLAIILRLRLR